MEITRLEYNKSITFYEKIINAFNADLSFYKILLESTNPESILELGCGSGRLFPLYEKVNTIVGIDISEKMLEKAEKKYRNLLKSKLILKKADMSNFSINRKFDLIIISNSALKHIPSEEARLKVIKNAKSHLSKAGILSIDHASFLYYERDSTDWINSENSVISEWIPNNDHRLNGFQWKKIVEGNKDIIKWRFIEGNEVKFETQFTSYIYEEQDLLKHLKQSKFHTCQVLSDYGVKGLSSLGKRFIALASANQETVKKYKLIIRSKINKI